MNLEQLPVKKIRFDPNQPRKEFDSIQELARSIDAEGLIQPIEVTKGKNGEYMVVDGERRLRAHIFLKRDTIPCIVKEKIDDRFVRQLVTDFHKKKLTISEQAEAIQKLLGAGKSADEIQKLLALGTNQYYLLKRIPELNEKTRALIKDGKLSQNQLSTISKHDILTGKEDEIVAEIIAGNAQGSQVIENIILSKQDINYMVNKYMSELFYFQKKIKHLTDQLKYSDHLVDFNKKQQVKDAESKLKDQIRLLQERLNAIIKRL